MTPHASVHPSRRGFLALATFAGISAGTLAQATAAHADTTETSGAERWDPSDPAWAFVPELSDHFDTATSAERWVKGLWYPGAGTLQRFHDDNVVFDPGSSLLRLRATVAPETDPARYRFAAVESTFDIPGVASYTEVRARMLDTRANVLSAIWQQSSNYDHVDHLLTGANPHPEVDVHELFHNKAMDIATHTWRNGNNAGHVGYGGHTAPAGVNLSDDFHLYGVERRGGTLRFYLDRTLVFEAATTNPDEYYIAPNVVHTSLERMSRHQVLSLEAHRGEPNPDFLPASFDIDYVNVYYHVGGSHRSDGTYFLRHRGTGSFLSVAPRGELSLGDDGAATAIIVTGQGDGTFTLATAQGLYLTITEGDYRLTPPVLAKTNVETGVGHDGSKSRWHLRLSADGNAVSIRSKFSGLSIVPSESDRGFIQVEPLTARDAEWELLALPTLPTEPAPLPNPEPLPKPAPPASGPGQLRGRGRGNGKGQGRGHRDGGPGNSNNAPGHRRG